MWTIVLILTLMMPAGVAAQTAPGGTPRPGLPPRDTPLAKPAATGKIRGRVLAVDTNAPLRRAQVTLLAGQLGVRRFTTTDADGRYEFADVAEGRYTVTAGKGGYVTLQYGQRRAFEPGRQVSVADGTELAAQKLARVLANDPAIGVLRHVDAGYPEADAAAEAGGLRVPMHEA